MISTAPTTPLKAALITGASRRIGRTIAEALVERGYGVALHASQRSSAEARAFADELTAKGVRCCVITGDLAVPADVGRLVGQAHDALGPLNVLVNNASLFENDRASDFDVALFDRHMAVNLRAPAQLASDFAKQLPQSEEGVIINLIDQRVWRLNPLFFSYTLSKSALWSATQTMAQAFAPRIRVNGVGPGPTLANHMQGQEGLDREALATPLERAIDPREIADAVCFLVQARGVTGQMIAVDGGQHLAWRTPDVEV